MNINRQLSNLSNALQQMYRLFQLYNNQMQSQPLKTKTQHVKVEAEVNGIMQEKIKEGFRFYKKFLVNGPQAFKFYEDLTLQQKVHALIRFKLWIDNGQKDREMQIDSENVLKILFFTTEFQQNVQSRMMKEFGSIDFLLFQKQIIKRNSLKNSEVYSKRHEQINGSQNKDRIQSDFKKGSDNKQKQSVGLSSFKDKLFNLLPSSLKFVAMKLKNMINTNNEVERLYVKEYELQEEKLLKRPDGLLQSKEQEHLLKQQ